MSAIPVKRRSADWSLARYPTRSRTVLWATFGLLGLVLVGYLAAMILRPDNVSWTWLDGWVVVGVELVATTLCIARGCLRRPGRGAALALGLGLLAWTAGDIALTVESLGGASPPTPSVADAFYLCFYPLAYVAVLLFMRGEVRRLTTPNWLDWPSPRQPDTWLCGQQVAVGEA